MLHIPGDSGTSTSALALLLVMQNSVAPCPSFALAGGAAGGVPVLSAAGAGQNQLAAEPCGTEFVPVPGTVAVPAVWTESVTSTFIQVS